MNLNEIAKREKSASRLRALASTMSSSTYEHWSNSIHMTPMVVAYWRELWTHMGAELDKLENQ